MRNLYELGIMAFIVMVALAPEVNNFNEVFQRLAFILGAITIGYLILRHRFRLRYYIRMQNAFNSERHQAKRWANHYRRNNKLQTA